MTDAPESFAEQANKLLQERSYVFLRCAALNNEIIAVIKDFNRDNQPIHDLVTVAAQKMIDKGKFKEQPPIYTVSEMRVISGFPRALVVHEAKKLGATIINTKELLNEEEL